MPIFTDSTPLEEHNIGHFGFTAPKLDDLESTGYTLATIVADRSPSTASFQREMEAALKEAILALQKHHQADSIMVRFVVFDSGFEEIHGFVPLSDIVDLAKYDDTLSPQGATALFDACVSAAEASANYGSQLIKDRFNANGIMIVITDGFDNCSRKTASTVAEAMAQAQLQESLESWASILIAVNMDQAETFLRDFHQEAKFTEDLIDLGDADANTIAKIGQFIASSVSSTSAALGTGQKSQTLQF